MKVVSADILKFLYRPPPDSHKGDNGRILIIAGSDKYHGALLLAIQAASRIVDMVYVHSAGPNLELIKKLKSETAVFIAVTADKLWPTVDLVDAVLIGPGLDESEETIRITRRLMSEYSQKKIVLDATALWHTDPSWLRTNVIVTPHVREFTHVFGLPPTADNVEKAAEKYRSVVVLKGRYDYVSDGVELWENRTGNEGMTKGGTGDVLAGLTTALAAKNDLLTAALAGVYLNGLAGDRLQEKYGTFYNAEDVILELGRVWKDLHYV